MTYDETMALLYLAKKLYPRDKSLDKNAKEMAEIGDVWAEMLQDIPFELGKAAVAAHAAGSPYASATPISTILTSVASTRFPVSLHSV